MPKKSARSKRPAKKPARRKTRSARRGTKPAATYHGWITHTELASSDPVATRAWCVSALGWSFRPSVHTPFGDYHQFTYAERGGGGIRVTNPPEVPGSMPYVEVADTQAAFEKALRHGAEAMLPPQGVKEGLTIAIVRAPGWV